MKAPNVVARLGALTLLAGCAAIRPAIPIAEIPPGDYRASAFIAMAPTLPADGEVIAAVLYTIPGGRRVEVRDSPRSWLWERSLGPGTGREHLALVKSPANYTLVSLPGPDHQPMAYAVLHRTGVRGSVLDRRDRSILLLSTLDFLDPNYIHSDGPNGR